MAVFEFMEREIALRQRVSQLAVEIVFEHDVGPMRLRIFDPDRPFPSLSPGRPFKARHLGRARVRGNGGTTHSGWGD